MIFKLCIDCIHVILYKHVCIVFLFLFIFKYYEMFGNKIVTLCFSFNIQCNFDINLGFQKGEL